MRRFCRPVVAEDNVDPSDALQSSPPLALLLRDFPDLRALVDGKRVMDVGCGDGRQVVALAREFNCEAWGLDTNVKALEVAKALAEANLVGHATKFVASVAHELYGTFDVVLSQNAMEHYPDPVAVLQDMRRIARPGGKILITFGPPWYAPYGAHMHFFCRLPWVNVLFREKTVMAVRALYRDDGATHYEEVQGGLNRMSLRKFEGLIAQTGLPTDWIRYRCVRGLTFLSSIPIVRELFVNHVACSLQVE
jgi:SAM-dependent methyltransferase